MNVSTPPAGDADDRRRALAAGAGNVYLGRQPILDRHGRTYAFELLYRDGAHRSAFFADPDDATRHVIESALLEWGFDQLIGDRLGLINAAGGLLQDGLLGVLPPGRTVVEILEDVVLDDAIARAVRAAFRTGMRFALDDVVDLERPGLSRIAPFIDIVKLDVLGIERDRLPSVVGQCREVFPTALLLAEKVEDHETYQECRALGFDLFQGYYFAAPETLERSSRSGTTASTLSLLAEVSRSDADIDRIETLITTDPTISYSLLRLVNSSAFGLSAPIQSVRQAIVLVGLAQVRQLALLLTMARNNRSVSDEVIVLAAVRAKLASSLADADGLPSAPAFTTGLLSVIDAVFRLPMVELLAGLPLAADVHDALVEGSGPLGKLLDVVRAVERGDVDELERLRPGDGDHVRLATAAAVRWAEQIRRDLTA